MPPPLRRQSRRAWLRQGVLGLAAATVSWRVAAAPTPADPPGLDGARLRPWPQGRSLAPLELPTLDGRTMTWAAFRGRLLLLNFWATWCPPCRAEMPTLAALPQVLGEDRVAVLAVNFRESARTVRAYLARSGVDVAVAFDSTGGFTQAMGVQAFPTTILIDRQGRPLWLIEGEVDWSQPKVLRWIEAL